MGDPAGNLDAGCIGGAQRHLLGAQEYACQQCIDCSRIGGQAGPDPQALARALAAVAPAAAAGESVVVGTAYALVGVRVDSRRGGAALIAVDGKAAIAKPYRVGAFVDGNLVVQWWWGGGPCWRSGMEGPAQMTPELPPLSK